MKGVFGAAILAAFAIKEAAGFAWSFQDPRALCNGQKGQGLTYHERVPSTEQGDLSGWTFNNIEYGRCEKYSWAQDWRVCSTPFLTCIF